MLYKKSECLHSHDACGVLLVARRIFLGTTASINCKNVSCSSDSHCPAKCHLDCEWNAAAMKNVNQLEHSQYMQLQTSRNTIKHPSSNCRGSKCLTAIHFCNVCSAVCTA